MPPALVQITPAIRKKLFSLAKRGASLRAIERETGVGRMSVRKVLREEGYGHGWRRIK